MRIVEHTVESILEDATQALGEQTRRARHDVTQVNVDTINVLEKVVKMAGQIGTELREQAANSNDDEAIDPELQQRIDATIEDYVAERAQGGTS